MNGRSGQWKAALAKGVTLQLGRPVPKKEERGKEAKVANLSQGGTLKHDGYLEKEGRPVRGGT